MLLFFSEFLLASLKLMLTTDLRCCQNENVEQHIWKIAFHNVIEALLQEVEVKEDYRILLFKVIDEVNSLLFSLSFYFMHYALGTQLLLLFIRRVRRTLNP